MDAPADGRSPSARARPPALDAAYAALAVLALTSLVQFPFSAPVYFLYEAPLVVAGGLAALTLARGRRASLRAEPVAAGLLAAYLVFAVLWIHPGFIYTMGVRFERADLTHALPLERAGLRASAEDARTYGRLVAELTRRAEGGYTLATPDAPEVYFLSGLRSPTGTTYEFFDAPEGRVGRVLEALERRGVTAVALNREPAFSGPPPAALEAALRERFPDSLRVGRFTVRWAGPRAAGCEDDAARAGCDAGGVR
ncbi:MAG: hypothetical protein D6701_12650 [Gemmatimonadetes bacterium]|nr:MAG: hypothetical protein D6701_12650 [Gemmatimonadota bacterium]